MILYSTEERQFEPFPMAIDVVETDFAEPLKLGFDADEFVRRIFIGWSNAESPEELSVELRRGRSDMFEIAEDAARVERTIYLAVESSLSLIGAVVNGEARHDRVKAAEVGQRMVEIVFNDPHFVVAGESFARGLEHGGRKIETNALRRRPVNPQQCQQPAVSSAEIKNAYGILRNELQQHSLPFGAMWNPIGAGEILQRVLGGGVLIEFGAGGHAAL